MEIEIKNWNDFSITIKGKIYKFDALEKKEQMSKIDFEQDRDIKLILEKNNIDHQIVSKYLKIKTFSSKSKPKSKLYQEALTSEEYSLIFNKKRDNPLKVLLNFIENIISNNHLIMERKIKPILYNLPLIYGIERTRINYYLWYINNKICDNCKKNHIKLFSKQISPFITFINYLKGLNLDDICDIEDFNSIIYLFVLELCEVFYSGSCLKELNRIPNIFNKLSPDFIEYKGVNSNTLIYENGFIYITKINNNLFEISNGYETKKIDGNRYNIEMLKDDLENDGTLPLEILLLKNESIKFYQSLNKVFIERIGLMPNFKKYFFQFIRSKCFTETISGDIYENLREVIQSPNIENILLNEKYLKFLPFPITGYLGFTNKDLLISVVSSYPLIIKGYNKGFIDLTKKQILYLKHYCYLMAIGEKFLTIVHEQALHFIYGYLNYLSPHNNLSNSPKNSNILTNNNNFNNGGNFLETKLFGKIASNMNLINVLTLLDGNCLNNSSQRFQILFNEENNLANINKRIDKCSGFLRDFLNSFKIDFNEIFELFNINLTYVQTKGNTEIYIELPKYKSSFIHTDLMENKDGKLRGKSIEDNKDNQDSD